MSQAIPRDFDVLIVGSGLAGLSAALHLAPTHRVAILTKFKAALDNRAHKAAVDADDKAGTDLGISGTPAFLINGYYVSGAQPFQKFKKLIDRALAEAK